MHLPAAKLPSAAEARRLAALRSYNVLDTPRESSFDDIVRIASAVCGTSIAVVNLIDAERQWFKAEIGLGTRETPLATSICAHAILEHDLLIVPDTTQDARFAGNPLVTGEPGLRFYAGALLKTAEGMAIGTVCVLDTVTRDISPEQIDTLRALARQVMMQLELRKMLHLAEQTSQYRARLLASAGHDFKAPLRSALYSIERARSEATSPAQSARLTTAEQELHAIDQGFNRLLAGASGKSTFTVAHLAAMPVDAVLASMESTWQRAAKRKNIRLRIVPSSLRIQSNQTQLEILVGNIVANAVKYTPHDGSILIGCRRRASVVELQVIDTGPGMAPETVDDLFHAFRQGDAQAEGLGLGLWIVRQTAEALGIDITVRSDGRRGTCFALRLPVARDA